MPLAVTHLRYVLRGTAEGDASVLLTDASLRVRSSADFVFYNQPAAPGARLESDGSCTVRLDLVAEDVAAVLLVASTTAPSPGPVTAALLDERGEVIATMDTSFTEHGSAQVCWELYRRGGGWKARAVGQGYASGLAELLTQHGVEVDPPEPAPSAGPPAPERKREAEVPGAAPPIPSLDPARALERLRMIFEDAARSCASFMTTRSYAERRRDQDTAAILSDQAIRNSAAGVAARVSAEQRYHDLVDTAQTHHDRDVRHLATEIAAITPALPVAMAPWDAEQWKPPRLGAAATGGSGAAAGDGLRIGLIAPPTGAELTIPFCLPLPLRRPIWVDAETAESAARVIGAVVVRLLADARLRYSGSDLVVDVIDPVGEFASLAGPLAGVCVAGPATAPGDVAARISALFDVVDLAEMAVASGMNDFTAGGRVVLLSGFPDSYDTDDKARLLRIASRGPAVGVVPIVASIGAPDADDPIAALLADASQRVPATGINAIVDPWVGNQWSFTADALPTDQARVGELFKVVGRR